MMQQTMNDRISILRESLKASPAPVLEVSGAFQVDFGSGQRVYAYAETYDSIITARYETKEADPGMRQHAVENVQSLLQNEIRAAQISGFSQTQLLKDLFVYTTRIDVDPAVFYHQTIVIGETGVEKTVHVPTSDDRINSTFVSYPDAKLEKLSSESSLAEVIREMETIDAKILRQGLDMMNLKRSSTVRIALTRIFRSVGDAEELAQVIQQEAGKIISTEDLDDLRMVQMIHADGFLKPVINLLYEVVFNKNKVG